MKKIKFNKILGLLLIFYGIIFLFIKYDTIGEYIISFMLSIIMILLGIKIFKKVKPENTIEIKSKDNMDADSKKKNIKYEKKIKIKGTSFHQEELTKIAKNGINYGFIKSYNGMTTKEIKEYGKIGQIEYEKLNAVNLQPYEFEGETAIKVCVDDFFGTFIEIGNIPKEEVEDLLPFIENQQNYDFIVNGYFVGGKYKEYDLYDEKMRTDEINIGIRLEIKIIEK